MGWQLLFPSCNLVCKNVLSKPHHFECLLAAVIAYQSAQERGKNKSHNHMYCMYQSDWEKKSSHTIIKSLCIQNRSQCFFTTAIAGDRQRDKQTIQTNRASAIPNSSISRLLKKKPLATNLCNSLQSGLSILENTNNIRA